ncbi:MAG: thiamine pyridinylase [Magnetococcales bacterium]|nr:thiamine pyridinylase [Magnetococcales bacterium]
MDRFLFRCTRWFLLALLGLSLFFSGVGGAQAGNGLTLALYPYVPRLDQFTTTIQAAWSAAYPDIPLTIIADDKVWDGGYSMDPPDDVDVFVFDATFLAYFQSKNNLSSLSASEVNNADDFLPFAIDGVKQSDNTYAAIPLLGCTNVLFYWNTDTGIAQASTLNDLDQVLHECTYTSDIPPDIRGLMVKGSASSNSYRYSELYYAQYGTLPSLSGTALDPTVVANGNTLLSMGSYLNSNYKSSDSYIMSTWFSKKYGEAMVGYTESLSAMTQSMRDSVAMKLLPMGNKGYRPTFYADVIGINSTTQGRGTRNAAVALANLLASTDVVVDSIKATSSAPAQYLMPTRSSAFTALKNNDTLYQAIDQMVTSSNPVLFALDKNVRTWMDTMETTVNHAFWSGYPCGCDVDATGIFNYAQAQSTCPSLCTSQGGWSGQWTNTIPGHSSVCGCNTCPLP